MAKFHNILDASLVGAAKIVFNVLKKLLVSFYKGTQLKLGLNFIFLTLHWTRSWVHISRNKRKKVFLSLKELLTQIVYNVSLSIVELFIFGLSRRNFEGDFYITIVMFQNYSAGHITLFICCYWKYVIFTHIYLSLSILNINPLFAKI